MLSLMNRLIRQLAAAGFIATAAMTSLIACAEAVPAQAAAFPMRPVEAEAPGWVDETEASKLPRLAQADVEPPAVSTDENVSPPAPSPSRADATGPMPPMNTTDPSSASAEPPAPSEYSAAMDTDPAALTDFRDTLSPYGSWVDDGTYGTVWVPASTTVGADFTPYVSNGHWGLTADGSWIWASDYNWGWAPFHYGRWVWIGGRGWSWIPGRVYSPAWVVWRTGYYDDYYVGWAPMPPTWYWYGGAAMSLWYVPRAPYVFCSSRYVFAPRVRGYIVPAERVGVIGPRTRPYVAATAGLASTGSYRFAAAARGPSMAEAHVPAAEVPSMRATHDTRALAFSRATLASSPLQPRSTTGAQPNAIRPSPFSRPPSRDVFTGPTSAQPAELPRQVSPLTAGSRPLPSMPAPRAPTVTEVPRPLSPALPSSRTFSGSPAPVMPPTVAPGPAPIAPRSFSPAPIAPRSFSPAPIAPRSYSPPPAAPARSFTPPAVRSNPSPAPATGRSFGGGRGRR
jgi:hypothetical protein